MFTVKATYRNETRKFTFSSSDSLPSYEELYRQLYRVYPISPSYYLSKLLFSPSSGSSRILIGMEAHSAEEYNTHVAPYQGRPYPGGLLRFHVYDETPHKSPTTSNNRLSFISTADTEVTDATVSEGASSATAVDSNTTSYVARRGDDRQVFLNRLRERTTSRSGVSLRASPDPSRTSSLLQRPPPSPPHTSETSSTASSRPLPQRPSSGDGSEPSETSACTVRPSLFDLLSQEPRSARAAQAPPLPLHRSAWRRSATAKSVQASTSQETESQASKATQSQEPHSKPKVPPPPPPSFADLFSQSWADLIIPPPPILYPTATATSHNGVSGDAKPDVMMASPLDEEAPLLGSYRKDKQPMETSPQFQAACGFDPSHLSGGQSSNTDARPVKSHCCSVAQGKSEIKAVLETFTTEFERSMKLTFGDDWKSSSASRRPFSYPYPYFTTPLEKEPRVPKSHAVDLDTVASTSRTGDLKTKRFPSKVDVCKASPFIPPESWSCTTSSHSAPRGSYTPTPLVVPPPPPLPWPRRASDKSLVVGGQRNIGIPTEVAQAHNVTCDVCNKTGFTGVRFKCMDCYDYDLCSKCMSSPIARATHSTQHTFFPIDLPNDLNAYFRARSQRDQAHVIHIGITCDACENKNITGVRHKCMDCFDYDLCTSCLSAPEQREKHNLSHVFFPIETPRKMDAFNRALGQRSVLSHVPAVNAARSTVSQPVVHRNVICDVCSHNIVGIRHKCLDCADFDMCGECIVAPGAVSRHENGRHQFFEIDRPGEVIVHTVFSGDGERVPPQASPRRVPPAPPPVVPTEPVVHNARCNMCDSRILDDRYKCLVCPDFDTCGSCFGITAEQHPSHGFVKVSNPDQLLIRNSVGTTIHPAMCNVCGTRVVGVRYKCLDVNCADFDMCQACEALPIPVHPPTHPLLKMKTPDTPIPFIKRAPQWSRSKPEPLTTNASAQVQSEEPTIAEVVLRDTFLRAAARMSPIPAPTILEAEPSEFDDLPPLIPMLQVVSSASSAAESHSRQSVAIPNSTLLSSFSDMVPPIVVSEPAVAPVRLPTPSSYQPVYTSTDIPTSYKPAYISVQTPVVEERLIDIDECKDAPPEPEMPSTGVTTPSEAPSSGSTNSIPRLGPVENNEWRDLWPELTTMFKHLLTPPAQSVDATPKANTLEEAMPGAMKFEEMKQMEMKPVSVKEVDMRSTVEESPLVGEPLLCRPSGASSADVEVADFHRRLNQYLDTALQVSVSDVAPPAPLKVSVSKLDPVVVASPAPLFASFMSDNNIPDGQIFPPGAEFVKSWRMVNDGLSDWPETTELAFVAGDRLAPHENAPRSVKVGSVKAGEQIEVAAGEMKAPEAPGKYVSYWRLSDGKGNEFGHSIWVDISVIEVHRPVSVLSSAEDESLAASSVIMPHAAPERSSTSSMRVPTLSVTIPSGPLSDDGSFSSSMSLVDLPSPTSDDDDEMYEDSRSRVVPTPSDQQVREVEYVMLYDSASSEEEI